MKPKFLKGGRREMQIISKSLLDGKITTQQSLLQNCFSTFCLHAKKNGRAFRKIFSMKGGDIGFECKAFPNGKESV
jgi:hypothetical protein